MATRDDVPDLLAAADIYVLTSHWEARALVVQEAMTAGVPVVATAVGGIPELVGDGAVLVAAGDDAAIAREVGRISTIRSYGPSWLTVAAPLPTPGRTRTKPLDASRRYIEKSRTTS